MYDRRLKAWNVTKNLSKARKDDIIDMLVESGTWTSDTIPSKARHLDINVNDHAKLIRYVKSRSRSRGASNTPESSPDQSHGRTSARSSASPGASRDLLSPSQEAQSWVVVSRSPDSISVETIIPNKNDQPGMGTALLPAVNPLVLIEDRATIETCPQSTELEPLVQFRPGLPQHNVKFDFVMFPTPTIPHESKSLNVEKLLRSINAYFDANDGVAATPTGQGYDHQVTLGSLPSEHISPSYTFWSELKHGIYLLKVQSSSLAWPALDRACELARITLSNPTTFDFLFLKELFLTLSPVNTRICSRIRTILLQYLSYLAYFNLPPSHPIAVICHELQHDDHDREVSERALSCMLNAIHTYHSQFAGTEMAVKLECSIITLLRRDGELELAAAKARTLFRKCQSQLPMFNGTHQVQSNETAKPLKHARMAATELAHVCVDQGGDAYDEAIEYSLFALTGKMPLFDSIEEWPPSPSDFCCFIQDKKSVHVLEDLAKIYGELGLMGQTLRWLEMAELLASQLYGGAHESTATAHIVEKLEHMRAGD